MAPVRVLVSSLFLSLVLTPLPVRADVDDDEDDEDEEGASMPPAGGSLSSYKSGGPLGIGFSVGTINGFSLKLWPVRELGVTLEAGVPIGQLNSLALAVAGRYHTPPIVIPDSPVAFHLGLGGRFRTRMVFREQTYVEIGGGAVVGVSLTVRAVPVEVFFEVAPTFAGSVAPKVEVGRGFDVDGLVGLRLFL
jgi:ribosomal protein L13E